MGRADSRLSRPGSRRRLTKLPAPNCRRPRPSVQGRAPLVQEFPTTRYCRMIETINISPQRNPPAGSISLLPRGPARPRCTSTTSPRVGVHLHTTTSTERNGCLSLTARSRFAPPDGKHTLDCGDLVRFPAGPAGAHEIMNKSDPPARTLLFASSAYRRFRLRRQQQDLGVVWRFHRRPRLRPRHRRSMVTRRGGLGQGGLN